jgi:hypothetical protein
MSSPNGRMVIDKLSSDKSPGRKSYVAFPRYNRISLISSLAHVITLLTLSGPNGPIDLIPGTGEMDVVRGITMKVAVDAAAAVTDTVIGNVTAGLATGCMWIETETMTEGLPVVVNVSLIVTETETEEKAAIVIETENASVNVNVKETVETIEKGGERETMK